MGESIWWMAALAISGGNLAAGEVIPAKPYLGGYGNAQPMVVVGSESGSPSIRPDDAIDPNSPLSPFAGVVSIFGSNNGQEGTLGTGVAISRRHILTAAHVVDWTGGQRFIGEGFGDTGDGILDAVPSLSHVNLNAGPMQQLGIDRIDLHPDWNGFLNLNGPTTEQPPSLHDDLAIITLAADLPASVPIYPLSTTLFEYHTPIAIVGYGQTGHGDEGALENASFGIKRYGWNVATEFYSDDEAPRAAREVFLFDFDGPTLDTDLDGMAPDYPDGLPTLGNHVEVTIAPGDSGGPSFSFSDMNNDGVITVEELTLFGINTFGMPGVAEAPQFGSWGGGMSVSSYLDFITSVIPEPGMGGVLVGLMLLLRGRRQRR